MNKSEFIEQTAAKLGITATEYDRFLYTTFNHIYELLAKGEKVNFSGFGQFFVYQSKTRLGINPRTLVKMTINATKTPKFKCGEAFKAAVNK